MKLIEGIDTGLAAQIQRQIFGEVLGRVASGERDRFFDGDLLHLPFSVTLRDLAALPDLEEIVAPSALKLIKAPLPADGKEINPDETTALGGWCALFSGDYDLIKRGILPDPVTGRGEKLEDIGQLTRWLTTAVRMDQIVEAVYPLRVPIHAGINETRLWSAKIIRDLTANNVLPPEQLEGSSIELIATAIEHADAVRTSFTQRFLRAVSGDCDMKLTSFSDRSKPIFDGLTQIRDQLFNQSKINEFRLDEPSQRELETEGLLWSQYTGPYVTMLQETGVIPKKHRSAIFSEPVYHASPTLPEDGQKRKATKAFFNTVFGNDGGNVFFWSGPDNINEHVGQLAMVPCFGIRGPINPATNQEWRSQQQRLITSSRGSRQRCTIADVPNVHNWEEFWWSHLDVNIPSRLADSNVFAWSANLLTTFREPVARMMELCNIFRFDTDSEMTRMKIREIQSELKEWLRVVLEETFTDTRQGVI